MNDTEILTIQNISESIGFNVSGNEVEKELDIPYARRTIEAVLFAAGHPVSYEKLAQVLSSKPSVIRKIVSEFAEDYNSPRAFPEKGIMLLCFDDSCQLCTKEEFGDYIREALGIRRGGNLSASSLEVLAIIAYNEPVTRAYVDTVRGVDSAYTVSTLADKHLIEPCGRLDVPGRPLLYRTTDNFLRVFGLNSLSELPSVDSPRHTEQGETIPMEGLTEGITEAEDADDGVQDSSPDDTIGEM